jgi:hypothetical protein
MKILMDSYDDFVKTYRKKERSYSAADIRLMLNIALFKELHREFDYETALDFFNAESAFTKRIFRKNIVHRHNVVYGLNGLNCVLMESKISKGESCEGVDACDELNANYLLSLVDDLCCFSVERENNIVIFRKWIIRTESNKFSVYDGEAEMVPPITYDGLTFDNVTFSSILNKEERGFDDPCSPLATNPENPKTPAVKIE